MSLFLPEIALPILLGAAAPSTASTAPSAILPVPLQPVVGGAQRTCASKTASGLGYSILRPGAGTRPGATDLTLIAYIGYLAADGQVFDQNPQAVLPVDGVVPGFGEGLQLMSKAGIYRFCIPAALGYGATATGPIPANSDLVFQVELMDHKTKAEVEAMQSQQEATESPAPSAN